MSKQQTETEPANKQLILIPGSLVAAKARLERPTS